MGNYKLCVQLFSKFSVSGMGVVLDEDGIRSEMLVKLFTYILLHREKDITVQELVDVLWDVEASDNPAGALKNLVYRLRSLLKKTFGDIEFINTGRGAYRWNEQIDVEMDIAKFETYYEQALHNPVVSEKIEQYLSAVKLYKGMLLPKLASEYWVVTMSTFYHSMYLTAIKEVAELLNREKRYVELGKIANAALHIENLDEDLHCYFIWAMVKQKKYQLAKEHYRKAVDLLYENLGVSPSAQMREIYTALLAETHEEEMDIKSIQQELDDGSDQKGAYLCEYGVFKASYNIEKRRSQRMGISVYLFLITIIPTTNIATNSKAYFKLIKKSMEALESVLLRVLRTGDVVSRFSSSQYVVMLPTLQYETTRAVTKRVERAFVERCRDKVMLQFNLTELYFSEELNNGGGK